MTFAELGIPAPLIEGLAKQQISEPTPIQVAAIPVLLAGRDAYLNAETGTGKTLAYLLPLFTRVDINPGTPQLVVLAPTHELAIQIQRQCGELAVNSTWPVRSVLLIGGTAVDRQLEKLKKKPQVVIGSPGRIRELIDIGKLKIKGIKAIVIDEADKLLVKDSLPAVRAIVQALPRERQLIFASATEQPESASVLEKLAPGLLMLRVAASPVNERIEHLYIVCEARDKPEVLRKLLHALTPERAMVFVHRNETAQRLADYLDHHKIQVADLHASFDKLDRKEAMDSFRSGAARVMIASDVAARGLDIAGVTHIINIDPPTESKAYLHRVGRTARAGAKGVAVSLMTEDEVRLVNRYETELGITIRRVRLREGQVLATDGHALGD